MLRRKRKTVCCEYGSRSFCDFVRGRTPVPCGATSVRRDDRDTDLRARRIAVAVGDLATMFHMIQPHALRESCYTKRLEVYVDAPFMKSRCSRSGAPAHEVRRHVANTRQL